MSDPDLSSVNPQILQAVKKSTNFAFGQPYDVTEDPNAKAGKPAFSAGTAIAFEKVAQSAAFSVQDAVDYQRNMLAINGAAQGKALAMMFKDVASDDTQALEGHAVIFVLSLVGSFAAGLTAEYISNSAGKSLEAFPKN